MNNSIRSHSQTRTDRMLGLILMIPVAVIIVGIMGIPLVKAIYLSFTDKTVGQPETFIGLENYFTLFSDPTYWQVIRNTFIYTAGSVGLKLLFGVILAVILNKKFIGCGFFRTVLLIPWALPGTVAATTWRWMFDSTYGIINSLLLSWGVISVPIAWLSDPKLTLYTAMIVNIWRGVPFFIFSLLGALQTIDNQMYEAAYLDGAGTLSQFWFITLPSIYPVLKITTLLSAIWTFNDFENVYLVTGGGPVYASSVISTYTYDLAFIQNSFGQSLSAAVSIIPVLLLIIIISQRSMKEKVN